MVGFGRFCKSFKKKLEKKKRKRESWYQWLWARGGEGGNFSVKWAQSFQFGKMKKF